MIILKFVKTFMDDHPLCCCSEEISDIKKSVLREGDEMKLKQKTSSLTVVISEQEYKSKYNINVPDDYPDSGVM